MKRLRKRHGRAGDFGSMRQWPIAEVHYELRRAEGMVSHLQSAIDTDERIGDRYAEVQHRGSLKRANERATKARRELARRPR